MLSRQPRRACPVTDPKVVGVGRLALPRLFGFEPNRSDVPGKPHAENWCPWRDLHSQNLRV